MISIMYHKYYILSKLFIGKRKQPIFWDGESRIELEYNILSLWLLQGTRLNSFPGPRVCQLGTPHVLHCCIALCSHTRHLVNCRLN